MSSKSDSGSSESLLEETSSSELDYDIEHDDRAMSPGNDAYRNAGCVQEEWEDSLEPYTGEPLADEEWLKSYNARRTRTEKQSAVLNNRFNGRLPISLWCKCENCKTEQLTKPNECKCCTELEAVASALTSEIVVDEFGSVPKCITEHPGFRPLCLEPWSLRFAADKYKTKLKERYKKTKSDFRFFRAVSYREFTRLVHGRLGTERIPLPACAYNVIRQQFSEQDLVGYHSE